MMSGLSAAKSLPPTPVELEAADKAASLRARLEDLERRKRNLHKIIHELRESLRKNAVVFDARKRNEVDKMIINLHLELQEITNEEHEVALRLHRVQKRRDKDDFYEQPTGLWIKRVTT
jgi:DNA repair exonuclease SbcCD ATPase subunit